LGGCSKGSVKKKKTLAIGNSLGWTLSPYYRTHLNVRWHRYLSPPDPSFRGIMCQGYKNVLANHNNNKKGQCILSQTPFIHALCHHPTPQKNSSWTTAKTNLAVRGTEMVAVQIYIYIYIYFFITFPGLNSPVAKPRWFFKKTPKISEAYGLRWQWPKYEKQPRTPLPDEGRFSKNPSMEFYVFFFPRKWTGPGGNPFRFLSLDGLLKTLKNVSGKAETAF